MEKILNAEIKRGLDEKISDYAHRLADLLKNNEDLKDESIIIDWVDKLEAIK